MFHFVLLSGGAILIGRSYPPPPRPLSVPLAPPRLLVLYTHPLATTTAAAAAHLLFLYYNVRALSGGSDGSGAEAGLPAGCRLERVPGWDCFSNELHSSGLYVSVWGTPPFALAGSFPPCARANLLFFLPPFLFFRSLSSPRPSLFSPRAAFDERIILVNGHPRVLRGEYCMSRSPSGHHRVSVETLSSSSSLPLPSFPYFFKYFSCALSSN